MEMILLIGGQGAGKSTFYRQRFFNTHLRINLDMLKNRKREHALIRACLEAGQRFVVDNTNPTASDRRRYFDYANGSHFKISGYFFEASVEELLHRNAQRSGKEVIPEIGVRSTFKKLQRPQTSEGFDAIFRVQVLAELGDFQVQRWQSEV